jgi:hypothetical protein
MKRLRAFTLPSLRSLSITAGLFACLSGLLLYRLNTLTGGLTGSEYITSAVAVGWHGVYDQPLYLPLTIVRSIIFVLQPDHGDLLTRLPNALFGGLTIITFAWLIRLWHGTRTAFLAGLLFATSAWVLHVSRLASFDVLYLWAIPMLLVTHVQMHRNSAKDYVFYGSMLMWGFLLFIPGVVWLVIANTVLQRKTILQGWRLRTTSLKQALYVLCGAIWLPLLATALTRPGNIKLWLGIPDTLASPHDLLKQFAGVFVHLFIRGPQYPELWLNRAPLLDLFALGICIIGIYFYATHRHVARTKLLAILTAIGILLVALGGPVGISLLVPILYIAAATGIAYLLHEWLAVFPVNPFARGLGISLIFIAVAVSCAYNMRAYYIAWPHNVTTQAIFRYHR